MAQFSHIISKVPGLRFIAGELELRSEPGRQCLLRMQMMTTEKEINSHLDKINEIRSLLIADASIKVDTSAFRNIRHSLSEIRDITGTLHSLKEGLVLDDISLFEIKHFALISESLKDEISKLKSEIVSFNDLSEVISLLDPDKQRVPHFFIYDSYDKHLAELRRKLNLLVKSDADEAEKVRLEAVKLEDKIRQTLSIRLLNHLPALLENLALVGELDLWLAKAELAITLNLCKPLIVASEKNTLQKSNKSLTQTDQGIIKFTGLFNPEVADALEVKGKKFQPIDIVLTEGPCLITGANMAGKTVLLKTVALAQYLFQYGFFVPALKAQMQPVERIMTSMEDEQSELKGLSSYASEMLRINSIIHASKSGNNILALIDEPARTTNPVEGSAIVNGLLDILQDHDIKSLITTHYSGIESTCRRLRVLGLKTDEFSVKPTIETINDYMDYSLIEIHPGSSTEDEVPHEALKIAEILEIDEELLEKASFYINKTSK
jgi:DNA mismatch repair ATPase MutS